MPPPNGRDKLSAFSIALLYCVAGWLWIFFSDKLVLLLAHDSPQAYFLQTYKGWFYVTFTALLLYWLVRRMSKRLQDSLDQEQQSRRKLSQALARANISFFTYHTETQRFSLEEPGDGGNEESWQTREIPLAAFVHPEDLPRLRRVLDNGLGDLSTRLGLEFRMADGQGKWRWGLAMGAKDSDNDAGATIAGALFDITERKSMEWSLQESRRELSVLTNAIPDYIGRFDLQLRQTFMNKPLCEVLKVGQNEYHGKTLAELGVPRELLDIWTPTLQKVLRTGQESLLQFDVEENGEIRSKHSRVVPELDGQGGVSGIIAVTRDITEIKRAHEALLATEKRLNDAQRIAHIASYEFDLRTGKGFWSNQLFRILGYAPAEVESSLKLFLKHVHPEDRDKAGNLFANTESRRDEFALEFRYVRTNKQVRHAFISGKILRGPDGLPLFFQGILQDISERKRVAQDYALLVTAIEQANEGVIITDADGVLQYINPAFEQATGYRRHEVLGHTPRILKSGRHDARFYATLWRTISSGSVWHGRITNRRKDGTLYESDTTISPVRSGSGAITNYVALERDVTERTRLENQLRQAQKMEAIGTLAGGIAHDFNNILAAIMGFSEIALMETPKELQSVRESLQDILAGSRRGSELVRNILTFSRQGTQDKVPMEVQSQIKESLKLLRASLPSNIRIQQRLEMERGVIVADPSDIQQLVLNLCSNAGQAMGEKGGTLTISLRNHVPETEELAKHPNLKPGPHMHLQVEDTGPGIKSEILERIFDPFFTTKEPGEGTGLGLSIVHGIVQGNDGAIEVDSALGRGTLISVLLPLSSQEVTSLDNEEVLLQGSQRILLAEDDSPVSRSLERLLGYLGYQVQCGANGQEALEFFQKNPDSFDLLLTDQMMPIMDGLQLAQEVRATRPTLPIVIVTGRCTPQLEEQARQLGIQNILTKPIELQTLSQTVHEALAGDVAPPTNTKLLTD